MTDLFTKEAKIYVPKDKIKAAKYKKGMENGYILRFYEENHPSYFGAIICTSLDNALEEMKTSKRERFCFGKSDNKFVSVFYDEPVPIIISHKYTDEEYDELINNYDYNYIPPFLDDTEDYYSYEEITEENCWIVFMNGTYTTESKEFMERYELIKVEGLDGNG